MSENWKLQASYKIGDVMINVRGEDGAEFAFNLDVAIELAQKIDDVDGAIRALSAVNKGGMKASYVETSRPAQSAPVAPPQAPAPSWGPGSSATLAPAPATEGGSRVVVDKWGTKWTYGLPDAPQCARGEMVLKSGTNKAGKPYKGWFDPASGPEWSGGAVNKESLADPIWER